MITKLVKRDLQIWFKKYTKKEPDLGRIIILVEADNIYQVLFDYGIENTLILLEYFLHTQEFLDCAEILRQIQAHNKLTGDNHPTILEGYYESIRRKSLGKKDL
jgi:hypothetical protein